MNAAESWQHLRALLRYAAQDRPRILLASGCSVANKLFDIAPEILIGIAIDVVVRREQSWLALLGLSSPSAQLLVLAVATIVIWVAESGFEYAYQWQWRNLAQDLQHRLRVDAFASVQRLSMADYSERRVGELASILADDINQLERFTNVGANALIQVLTTVLAIGGVFFALSPLLAAVAFLPIPLILWGALWFQRRAAPRYAEVRERVGALTALITSRLEGLPTIRAYGRERHELERLIASSQDYVHANRDAIALSSAFIPVIRMAILSGFVVTFTLGGWLVLEGHLEVGWYGVLVFLTQRLLWPLTELGETLDLYQRAMASARRALDLIDRAPSEPRAAGRGLSPTRGELRLHSVGFRHDDGRGVLADINLNLTPGHLVALVGGSGSGKSTLLKLILGFYAPDHGQVLLDGEPLADYDPATLRRAIAWVGQEPFLFDGSVLDNLRYGRPDADLDEVEAVARAAQAHAFITALPQGYHTAVGERGQKLSGGERQRIALARALLTEARVLLLDEATSALDQDTEALVTHALRAQSRTRSVLVVAHRLSSIQHADEILVLDQGHIRERGRHAELLARQGAYAALWQAQQLRSRAAPPTEAP